MKSSHCSAGIGRDESPERVELRGPI